MWRYVLTYAAVMAFAPCARAELEAGARALLDHEVDEVVAGEYDPPPVERVLRRGRGFSALLPGSVSQ